MAIIRAGFALACCVLLMAGAAGAQGIVATLPIDGAAVAIDVPANRVYVAGGDAANVVTAIDGSTNAAMTVPVGRNPLYIAVNSTTHRVYVSNNDDDTLSVIDGATLAVATLPIGGAGPVVIDERTNRAYVMRRGNNGEVTVVDASNNWYTINTGSHTPFGLVVNPDTNRLYVSHLDSGDVRAIDMSSTSDHPPTVSVQIAGHPSQVAVNRATNKVYVLSEDSRGNIVEIDGATNAATRIPATIRSPSPEDVVVNPVTNRVYAAFFDQVVVVDGAMRAVSYIPTGLVRRVAVDPVRNRIYARGDSSFIVIDGATQNYSVTPMFTGPRAIAVNPATNRIYLVGVQTVVLDGAAVAAPQANFGVNMQGMWWAAPAGSESGWGLDIAHQGNTLFATWFTYDTDGTAMWLVMPNAPRVTDRTWTGDVYRVTGPPYNAATFDPATVRSTVVGTLSITLFDNDDNLAQVSGTVNGATVLKRITREVYAAPVPVCTTGGAPGALPNYQDIWWASPAGSESGWGLYLTHQGDILFAVLFTYDEAGKALWLVASNVARIGNANYSGTLFRTWGPPYTTQSWDSALVRAMPVGTLSLAFSDANNGVLTYSYAGVTRTKAITREAFATPATVCR